MKKLLALIFVILNFSVLAQSKLGLRLGANSFKPTFDPKLPGESSFAKGYEGGIVFQHLSDPHLGIQLEAIYAQTSWQQNFDSANYFRQELRNVEVPFVTHIYLNQQHKGVFLDIGTTTSYTVSSKNEEHVVDSVTYHYQFGKRLINRFQFGLTAGIGYIINIGSGALQIAGRFTQRFTNLLSGDKSNKDFRSSPSMVLSVSIAYLLNLRQANGH
jgi:hypothetical protein